MMKKPVFGLFAISILIFVYFITYFVVLSQKQNEVFHEIVEESKKTNDYELFLKYQPNASYHKLIELDSVVNENYRIKAYQVIQTDNQSLLVIFVQVLNGDYATSIDDDLDQTKLVVSKNSDIVYDSKTYEGQEEVAYSFGIDVMGFYYYQVETTIEALTFELYDYHGDLITTDLLNEPIGSYDPSLLIDNGFETNFTSSELSDLLSLKDETWVFVRNLAITIALELGLYLWLMKKK